MLPAADDHRDRWPCSPLFYGAAARPRPPRPRPSASVFSFSNKPQDCHGDFFVVHGHQVVDVFFDQGSVSDDRLPDGDAVGDGRGGRQQAGDGARQRRLAWTGAPLSPRR